MPFGAEPLILTEDERRELQQMTQSRTLPAGDVMRSRMILLLAERISYQKIQNLLDTTAPTIARWKERFLRHRIACSLTRFGAAVEDSPFPLPQ